MYMDIDFNLDFNDFVLMTDDNGNLTCGGFTINNDLLLNSSNSKQTGGSNDKSILKKLKDLGLPPGLVCNPVNNTRNKAIKYEHDSECCDNSIYDILVDLVNVEDKKKHNVKTRKKRENRKKLTRKSKK
jgi:hypothetical protein